MSNDPLAGIRQQIDSLDSGIILLLAKRSNLVKQVAKIKKELGMEINQPNRFNDLLARLIREGKEAGLDEDLVKNVWNAIHESSKNQQQEHFGNKQ